MLSEHAQGIVRYYTRRHDQRRDLFGDQPFANYGYWTRPDMTIPQAAEAMAALVAGAAGLCAEDQVLDVGCGYGACAVVYAERFKPASIIGIDITETRIEHGRRYVEQRGLEKIIDLRVDSATAMSLPSAHFDKLLAVECAFHFDTRLDFFAEAARVLKPGGILALTDLIPKRGADVERYLEAENRLAPDIDMYNRANAYDADAYLAYLRAAGFTDIRIDTMTPWTLGRFAPELHRYADRPTTVNAEKIHQHADRLLRILELGEEYVLVVARKTG